MLSFVRNISVKFVCRKKAYNITYFTCTRLFNLSELSLSNIHAHEYWLYFFTNIFIGVFQYYVANKTLFKTLLYFVAKIYKKCLGPELLWMTSWDDWESSEEDGCQKDRGGNLHQKVLQDRACVIGWGWVKVLKLNALSILDQDFYWICHRPPTVASSDGIRSPKPMVE